MEISQDVFEKLDKKQQELIADCIFYGNAREAVLYYLLNCYVEDYEYLSEKLLKERKNKDLITST